MGLCNLTEKECSDFLIATAKDGGEKSPRAITVLRTQSTRSITRTVKIALIVTTNNTTLLDFLIEKCLDKDEELIFVGSEVNLQSDLEIDYFFFEAKIMAKKQG